MVYGAFTSFLTFSESRISKILYNRCLLSQLFEFERLLRNTFLNMPYKLNVSCSDK